MGSELLTTGSVLAAFFAGGVALFAPCCIVFLAPSYIAGATRNRRWRLLPLTFIFAAGLSVVLIPLTLGASLLAGAIARYHAPLYVAGGLLMYVLAYLTIKGKMWSLPSVIRMPDTSKGDTGSFFALGVFSGIASSCCAPVLVGVMTLSALSGSVGGGILLGVAYVFGMVFPLFIMALVWDKARLADHKFAKSRPVKWTFRGKQRTLDAVNLAVAATFVAMGTGIIWLAQSTEMTGGSALQDWFSRNLVRVFSSVEGWLSPVPEPVLGLMLFAVVGGIVFATLADRKRRTAARDHVADENERIPS